MATSEQFSTGYTILDDPDEHVFLSVTPAFEHGPGIQRDGISAPRMKDPHSVTRVTGYYSLENHSHLPSTTNAFSQRAGTWTLYHHLKEFVRKRGNDWDVIGVQSNGDLTMNPWHVAYIGCSHVEGQDRQICGLLTYGDPQEPIPVRPYRCLVKWNAQAACARKRNYEFVRLRFYPSRDRWGVRGADTESAGLLEHAFRNVKEFDRKTNDLSALVEFALSAKPIVQNGLEMSPSDAVDKFDDVRHVFSLPQVATENGSFYDRQPVKQINFGEYQLFRNLNERRAALFSPIVIDLDIGERVWASWDKVRAALLERHYRLTTESPTRRGQFRCYEDETRRQKVEIFFPRSVYPFGAIGLQASNADMCLPGKIVSLASSGLSGRVGNNLEGTIRIMGDFFGCSDAVILDEGFDVFQISNPKVGPRSYKYTNLEMLRKILTFTRQMVEREHAQSQAGAPDYLLEGGMKSWPLNKHLIQEMDRDFVAAGSSDFADVLAVAPHRSQMRSVLIFAAKKQTRIHGNRKHKYVSFPAGQSPR